MKQIVSMSNQEPTPRKQALVPKEKADSKRKKQSQYKPTLKDKLKSPDKSSHDKSVHNSNRK